MTTIQIPPVQAPLAAALAAFVGDRVYQNSVPQDYSRPYARWVVMIAQPESLLGEDPVEDDQVVTCTVYAADQPTARKMMQAGTSALQRMGTIKNVMELDQEEDTRLFSWIFDCEVWNERA